MASLSAVAAADASPWHHRRRAPHVQPLPDAGREKAETAAAAVGAMVVLPKPVADQVAKGKSTDWNDYEASQGVAATRAALRTAGLQELAAQGSVVHVWTAPWVQGVCCMI